MMSFFSKAVIFITMPYNKSLCLTRKLWLGFKYRGSIMYVLFLSIYTLKNTFYLKFLCLCSFFALQLSYLDEPNLLKEKNILIK